MKKSTFIGSTVSLLLLFSVISYSRTYIQPKDPKPIQPNQQPSPQANPVVGATEAAAKEASAAVPVDSKVESAPVTSATVKSAEPVVLGATYTATAYSLRGRTASGKQIGRA